MGGERLKEQGVLGPGECGLGAHCGSVVRLQLLAENKLGKALLTVGHRLIDRCQVIAGHLHGDEWDSVDDDPVGQAESAGWRPLSS